MIKEVDERKLFVQQYGACYGNTRFEKPAYDCIV